MTIKAFEAQVRHLPLIEGKECVRAGIGYARALLLDFEQLHPPDARGYQEPERSLVVECCWRLETATEVLIGSSDEDDELRKAVAVCVGRRISGVEVFRPSFMLHIQFTDNLSLWVFPDSASDFVAESEYPRSSWFLAGRAVPEGWEE